MPEDSGGDGRWQWRCRGTGDEGNEPICENAARHAAHGHHGAAGDEGMDGGMTGTVSVRTMIATRYVVGFFERDSVLAMVGGNDCERLHGRQTGEHEQQQCERGAAHKALIAQRLQARNVLTVRMPRIVKSTDTPRCALTWTIAQPYC